MGVYSIILMDYDYDLMHDEIKKIDFRGIARAGPLSPCIAIGIYDELSKSGYIAYALGTQTDIIKNTINTAVADFKDIKKLKVAVAGAGKSYLTGDNDIDEIANKVSEDTWKDLENLINYFDFNKRKVRLYKEKERGMVQFLYLDCFKGRLIVESSEEQLPNYPLEDYMNDLGDDVFFDNGDIYI
jgi:hypothetical protein